MLWELQVLYKAPWYVLYNDKQGALAETVFEANPGL